MTQYIADVLTALRLLLGFVVGYGILTGDWPLVCVFFAVAILTDAFDGIAARRWPYSKDQIYWWRRLGGKFLDNLADAVMLFSVLGALSIGNSAWRIVTFFVAIGTINFHLVIHTAKHRLKALAVVVDIIYGWTFAGLLLAISVFIVIQASPTLWGFWLIVYGVGSLLMLQLKRDRAFSRTTA